MHCHDVLGITETTTVAEAEAAFHNKLTQLYSAAGRMPADAYSYKLRELKAAYEECIEWSNKTRTQKLEERMEETCNQKSGQVKLYSSGICIGPCTCLDACFYCGNTGTSTCCISTVGSQAVPIICDSLIWIAILAEVAGAVCPYIRLPSFKNTIKQRKIEKEALERANRQSAIDKIREETRRLEQQLNDYETRIVSLQQQIEIIEKTGVENAAFTDLFSVIGVTEYQVLSDNQKQQIQQLQAQIKSCKEQADELKNAIANNRRRIESM